MKSRRKKNAHVNSEKTDGRLVEVIQNLRTEFSLETEMLKRTQAGVKVEPTNPNAQVGNANRTSQAEDRRSVLGDKTESRSNGSVETKSICLQPTRNTAQL